MTDVSCTHKCTWPDCTAADIGQQKPVAWILPARDFSEWPTLLLDAELQTYPDNAKAHWVTNARPLILAAPPAQPAQRLTDAQITQALRRAYHLGQTYWQQADSEFTSEHRKADATEAKFRALIAETIEAAQKDTP